jgi:hypothetical protein
MVRLATRLRRLGALTLVEGRLHNDASEAVRVTVDTDLDPVVPPHADGDPAAGWHDAGRCTLVVPPHRRAGLGFATPRASVDDGDGEPADESPPLWVTETEYDPPSERGLPATPAGVADALGDPRPPAAVTEPNPTRSHDSARPGVTEDLTRLRRAAVAVASAAAGLERRLGPAADPSGERRRRPDSGGHATRAPDGGDRR